MCAAAQKDPEAVDVGAPERLITSVGLGLLWAGALCECHRASSPSCNPYSIESPTPLVYGQTIIERHFLWPLNVGLPLAMKSPWVGYLIRISKRRPLQGIAPRPEKV